jgi:hypothetical protein
MKKYPRLSEMGVEHPLQIAKYAVNSIGYTDVLRIVYERPKGSFRPQSKTFEFPRVQKTVSPGAATESTDVVMETNPGLRAALEELQDLLKIKESNQDIASAIVEELRLLEEDIGMRSEYIKALASKIKPV